MSVPILACYVVCYTTNDHDIFVYKLLPQNIAIYFGNLIREIDEEDKKPDRFTFLFIQAFTKTQNAAHNFVAIFGYS